MSDGAILDATSVSFDDTLSATLGDAAAGVRDRGNASLPAEALKDAAVPTLDAELSLQMQESELAAEPISDWRDELSAKMQQYRTRRKPRAPKYPSLQIPLQLPLESFGALRPLSAELSRSSNALEPALESEPTVLQLGPELVQAASSSGDEHEGKPKNEAAHEAAVKAFAPTNLIEFPRSMESESWDGLAERVVDQPRILDAPEFAPPEPALGGILLESPPDTNPLPQQDGFVRPATKLRRGLALAFDAAFVGCGVVVWGWVAARVTAEIPPRPQLLITAVVAAATLWLSYQYLFMVYSGTTLGLLACGMELVSIEGDFPNQRQRRWRFLASLLSGASMMLGYAWVLLDEKQLCWHDRITHTYLRVRERRSL